MSHSLVTTTVSAVAGVAGIGIAQIPVDTPLGEWSKVGLSTACLMLCYWLLVKTIPAILETHKETNAELRKTMEDGLSKVETSNDRITSTIKEGNQQVATLLQSTLVQIIKERHP